MTNIVVSEHFVTFYSPGSFVHEETTEKIDSWNVSKAIESSKSVIERYGATPFAFRFTTRGRGKDDLDSKVIAQSPRYYLGGKVKTLADIVGENDPDNKILIRNMEGNGWEKVIVNTNSWKIVQPLHEDDIVLEVQ